MRILTIVSGDYGERHVSNLTAHAPQGWVIQKWVAPAVLPPIVDYPEEYVPQSFEAADLVVSFGELRGIAELIPEIVDKTGAKGVIAPIDNETWLPRGLARQLRGWLLDMGVACVTPKPLCSLTETHYSLGRRKTVEYEHPHISTFARYFGRPDLKLKVDPESRTIISAEVRRDAVCGCARFVAEGLVGVHVDEAEHQGGLLHHHFPCLASMGIDSDYDDTLMHISGYLLKEKIKDQIEAYQQKRYIQPGKRSEPQSQPPVSHE